MVFSWHGRVSEYVVIGVITTGFLKCDFSISKYFFFQRLCYFYVSSFPNVFNAICQLSFCLLIKGQIFQTMVSGFTHAKCRENRHTRNFCSNNGCGIDGFKV